MGLYRVTWKIGLAADNPRHAAQQALDIQRDRNSWATVFTVESNCGTCTRDVIDLEIEGDANEHKD